jgi:hypothetical protein
MQMQTGTKTKEFVSDQKASEIANLKKKFTFESP